MGDVKQPEGDNEDHHEATNLEKKKCCKIKGKSSL